MIYLATSTVDCFVSWKEVKMKRRKIQAALIALLICALALTLILQQIVTLLKAPKIKYIWSTMPRDTNKCTDFTGEVWKGQWRELPGLTQRDYEERYRMDEEIRVRMKWPAKLFRNDSRCSYKYPIPGYRIQSLCDPESAEPCCSVENGTCGISEFHCKCDECTDFREFMSAELLVWVTENPDCAIWNISTLHAWDSLLRQLSTMMMLMLSADTLLGAMPARASQSDLERCKGEYQLVDKDCSIYLSAHSINETRNGSICDGSFDFTINTAQVYMNAITDEAIEKVSKLIGVENSFLVTGVGMHFHLDFPTVKNAFIDKLIDLMKKAGSEWPKIIWIGIHNVDGFVRMDTRFHNNAISRFNDEVMTYMKTKNITFIRTFEMSQNLRSYDGQHYGVGFNWYKAQLLLNHLIRRYKNI